MVVAMEFIIHVLVALVQQNVGMDMMSLYHLDFSWDTGCGGRVRGGDDCYDWLIVLQSADC